MDEVSKVFYCEGKWITYHKTNVGLVTEVDVTTVAESWARGEMVTV